MTDTMEYRAWVRVRGIDVEGDDADALHAELERRYGGLGPVLSGAGNGVDVILATDRDTRAEAAAELYGAVADALVVTGLGDRHPTGIRIERAEVAA